MPDKNLLLVEGKDDEHVFKHLLGNTNRRGIWEVESTDGVTELIEELSVAPKTSGIRCIAAVADADFDPKRRWRELQGALRSAGYQNIPQNLNRSGLILPREGFLPQLGLWMMPNNDVEGMLEDFLSVLIRPGDELWDLTTDLIEFICGTDQRFIDKHRVKAQLHTWLAWQEEPGSPFGQAITRQYLNATAPAANEVLAWLDRVVA